jgi:hypothetical protein
VKIEQLLLVIAFLLLLIVWQLSRINSRLKERFPTEKEEDFAWSQKDPMGHWEAHKNDKLLKKENEELANAAIHKERLKKEELLKKKDN